MENLDPDDPRPHYLQVAGAIRDGIQNGTYAIGAKLPPHQDVADQYGVSIGTVKRAYKLLQQDRLIVTRQGMGTFVRRLEAEDSDQEKSDTLADVLVQLAALRRRMDAVERELRTQAGS